MNSHKLMAQVIYIIQYIIHTWAIILDTFSKGDYPSLVFYISKQAVLIIWAVQTTPLREKGKENRAVAISRLLASNKVNVHK